MIAVVVMLACTADEPGHDYEDGAVVQWPQGHDSGEEHAEALLLSPAEAEDLDDDPDVLHVRLVAAPTELTIGDLHIHGYAYNGQVPGPTLRAKRGDTLIVDLENDLDTDTTIHWHGVHVPWDMDGVTWMQDPVPPGGSFTYTFTLDQTGTYWYHPHFDTEHQVDRGLYGVLVVTDPDDPPLEERVLVFDSWNEAGEEHDEESSPELHDHGTSAWVAPQTWTVNSHLQPTMAEDAGSALRLRLLNASNTGYLDLTWSGIRHIGSDQGLLAALSEPEALLLAPGDRADVEILLGEGETALEARPHSLFGGEAVGDPATVLTIAAAGSGSAPAASTWPFAGGEVSADPGHTDVRYTFQGYGDTWMINGEVFPDVTIEELPLGADAIVEVRNISGTQHPFHLHGHAFEVLSIDGVPPSAPMIEDTVDVPIGSIARLRLVADNPGDWMAHCHILPHAHQGMMTVLRVTE